MRRALAARAARFMARFLGVGAILAGVVLMGADTLPGTNPITWAQLVTPGGAVIAAGLITSTVQLLKVNTAIDGKISGATLAFILSAVLYLIAAVALQPLNADGYLGLFATWVACGLIAVGIKSTTAHIQAVQQGTARTG